MGEALRYVFDSVAVEIEGKGRVLEPHSFTMLLNENATKAELMSKFITTSDESKSGMSSADVAGAKHKYTVEYSRQLLGLSDTDGDGYVSFEEFVTQLCSEAPEEEEDIRQIFDVFDADGDGLVSFEEL